MTICREKFSQRALKHAFVLTYDKMRRYEGIWHLERKLLFQECVFLESENEEALSKELMYGNDFNGITGWKNCLLRVGQEEEDLLRGLCGKEGHLEMYRGIICKGVPRITEGPLRGMENRIRRIDRHKRLASVEIVGKKDEVKLRRQQIATDTKMKPEYRCIPAGLEITEKVV